MPDDAQLLRRYLEEGSEAAFAELVERHLGLVYHSALRRLGADAHLAPDIAQTVFILLARKARILRGHPSLVGWLHATTYFTTSKALRTEWRRRMREREAQTMIEDASEPAATVDWKTLRPVLDDVLMKLDQRDREAVLYRYFEGRTYSEIGSRLGLGEGAAQKRVERALERIRTLLRRRQITSTSAVLAAMLSSHASLAAPAGLAGNIAGLAVASAAGAGVSSFSLLHFMSTTKITAGVAASLGLVSVIGVFSIAGGVYELRKSSAARAALAAANETFAAEQERLQASLRSGAAADQALADLQKKSDQVSAANSAAQAALAARRARAARNAGTARGGANPGGAANSGDWERFKVQFPDANGALLTVGKAQIDRNYRLFLDHAGLSPAQIEEFESRTAELWSQNVAMSPTGIHPTVTQLPDDQLKEIFGDQVFQQFQAFSRLMPANGIVSAINSSSGSMGVPLSSDQEQQLAQMVAANSPDYQSGARVNLATVNWANVEAQAQAFLSPAQLKSAQGTLLNYQFQIAAVQALRNLNANPPASAGGN